MNIALLDEAARDVLSSAILGDDWIARLEPIMTEINAVGGGPTRTLPPDLFAIPTSGLRQAFMDFTKSDHPPITAIDVIPAGPSDGFVADYMSPLILARRRNAFFNEFLRPRKLCHQTLAFLDATSAGDIRLMVIREEQHGRFEADELQAFCRTLPFLRSAAMISRASLHAMAKRQAEPFERRGEPVFYLDVDGRIAETNPAAERVLGANVDILRRRLVTSWPQDQARLDRALTAALAEERPGLVTLQGTDFATPVMALVLPVSGHAKDVFHTTAAFVVLVDPARSEISDDPAISLLSQAAELTGREVDVVRLVGMGRSPRDAADELGIAYGTIRNHLKAGFAKLGVHSQGELVALIQRLR